MKTQIINLEPHDDIISARDKLRWANSQRVILVWPKGSKLLNRKLDIALLKRESNSQGAELAIVTNDPEVRYHALHLEIPVFRSIIQAQYDKWRVPRKYRSVNARKAADFQYLQEEKTALRANEAQLESAARLRPNKEKKQLHPLLRILFFTIGVFSVLAVTAVMIPSAKLTLTIKSETQKTSIPVIAAEKLNQESMHNPLPLQKIIVTVEGNGSTKSTGTTTVPLHPATGFIQFKNLTMRPVYIPEGTIVRTEPPTPVMFTVMEGGKLEAGTESTITLPIQAVKAGTAGNLSAGTITSIVGILNTKISATNPYPTRHGSNQIVPIAQTKDKILITQKLLSELKQQAMESFHEQINPNDLLLAPSIQIKEVVSKEFTPSDGTPSNSLQLHLKITYQGSYIAYQDIYNLTLGVLDDEIPDNYIPLNNTVSIANSNITSSPDKSTYRWNINASRKIQPEVAESKIIESIRGRKLPEAVQILQETLPLEKTPQIKISPFWWPRIPVTPIRIQIYFQ